VFLYFMRRRTYANYVRLGGVDPSLDSVAGFCWFCRRHDRVESAAVVLDYHRGGEVAHIRLARCDMCLTRYQVYSFVARVIPLAAPFVMVPVIIWTGAETTLLVIAGLAGLWCLAMAWLARMGSIAGRSAAARNMTRDGWMAGLAHFGKPGPDPGQAG
jgi:hypothetical protein